MSAAREQPWRGGARDGRLVEAKRCAGDGCGLVATVAIRTQRPTRANLWTKLWWEESEAPAVAERYCGNHAAELIAALAEVLA